MATDKRITELPTATTPTGTELAEIIQGGANKKTTLQEIADLAGGSDTFDRTTVVTTGGTITLDMNSQKMRMFVGASTINGTKTIALSNTTNAIVFNFVFTLTNVTDVLTFPASFVMVNSDPRWNTSTQEWTPQSTGLHESSAVFDGTNWLLRITDALI